MIFQPGEIIVFLVVMGFFFLFRMLDQKDRKIHKARKYIDKQAANLQETIDGKKQSLEHLQESITSKEASTKEMLKRVESLLEEIDAHGEDLEKLQDQLTHYHRIMTDLSAVTDKAEQRMQQVEQRSDELQEEEQRYLQLQQHMHQGLRQAESVKQELEELIRQAEQASPSAVERSSPDHPPSPDPSPRRGTREDSAVPPEDPDPEPQEFPFSSYQDEFSEELDNEQEIPGIQQDGTDQFPFHDQEQPDESIEPKGKTSESQGTAGKKEQVRQYREEGYSASQIADEMGITRGEVELLLEILRFSEE